MPPSSPNSSDRGRLVVISGPSGAGKSTIVRGLLHLRPFRFSVSATTRKPRAGEIDGVHYHFVDVVEFRRMVDDSELLEWAEYGKNLYGTPLAPVGAALDRGEDMLLEIEVNGAQQVREVFPDATMVFIRPPSLEELERRLRSRGDTDRQAISRRLDIAADELSVADQLFEHVVVNDEVDRTMREVLEILDRGDKDHRPGVGNPQPGRGE